MTIHQLVAGFRTGDAISAEAEALDAVFKANGCGSAIWCMSRNTAEDARGRVGDLATLASSGSGTSALKTSDIAILHLSIGSPVNDVFRSLKCRKAIIYHNVTPAKFFERCNAPLARILEDGRRAVASLADAAEINLGVSAYNAAELAAMGYKNPRVFPLVIDTEFGGAADEPMRRALAADGAVNVLFVGRVVPNKRHDKLLAVFAHLRRLEPKARLVIAGSSQGNEAYKVVLGNAAKEMGLGVSTSHWASVKPTHTGAADLDGHYDSVVFTEFLKPSELNACYASAAAFLCMSEHEGFCAPLLEAMHWGVPVFADAQAAIPETLDGAGVLFDGAAPEEITETILRVVRDAPLREAVLAEQRARLARFKARDVWKEMEELGIANC